METPYEKYRNTIEWGRLEHVINELVENKDIELLTPADYVIGYLSKRLADSSRENNFRTNIILSVSTSLLGVVAPNLRGVTIGYSKDLLILRAYFDVGASEEDKKLIDCALTEVIADLWNEIKDFKYEPIELPYPEKMTALTDWVFLRDEN